MAGRRFVDGPGRRPTRGFDFAADRLRLAAPGLAGGGTAPCSKSRLVAAASAISTARRDAEATDKPNTCEREAPRAAAAALSAGRLRIALQPVRPARRTDLLCFQEALARVEGADGGLISAGHFAEALERQGLAPKLDRAALALALGLLRRDPWGRISVNISACSLEDRSWLAALDAATEADPAVTRRLIVELTETHPAPLPAARAFRDHAAARGAAFALDDFGAGHVDAALAEALRPDILKLDAAFCRLGEDAPAARRRVAGAVALAERLEAMTVAEGVSDAAHATWLAELGVDALQGAWTGAPVSVAA